MAICLVSIIAGGSGPATSSESVGLVLWPILIKMARKSRSTETGNGGELALLQQIRRRAGSGSGVTLGIGDDCALLRIKPGEEVAVTTDLSIEGRHFRRELHPAEAVGHRTLARGLSDIAAMGARPVAAFLSLGVPAELTRGSGREKKSWVERFLDGFLRLAEEHSVPLAGGDLAQSSVALADIVLVGAVPKGKALLRSGARPGDILYVTGWLGGSAAGLRELSRSSRARHAEELIPHLWPQPRIAQGQWLRRRGVATAAIDLSDGLSTDLTHLCEESGVSAEVDAALLPRFAGATLEDALHGGEDYELLFTAQTSMRVPGEIAGVPITRIGAIVEPRRRQARVMLAGESGRKPLEARGWEHFRKVTAKPE